VDAQRGHEPCVGKVNIPHTLHRLPMSRGSSPDQVKIPSATGTWVISSVSLRSTDVEVDVDADEY
jgi:hypothetical protein